MTYDAFKKQCYKIARVLDEPLLVFLIINWVLQCQLRIGDITSVDKFIQKKQDELEFTKSEFKEEYVLTEEDQKALERLLALFQESIDNAPENTRRHYDSYVRFCEKVVAPLLQEKYLESSILEAG